MRRSLKIIGFFGTTVLGAGILYAQVGDVGRVEAPTRDKTEQRMMILVEELYGELASPREEQTCRVEYTTTTEAPGPEDTLLRTTISTSYVANEKSFQLTSSEVLLYQDTAVGVTILPTAKEIQVFPSTTRELQESRLRSTQSLYKALFATSRIARLSHDEKTDRCTIDLVPSARFSQRYSITRVVIGFNPEARRIETVRTEFDDDAPYRSMELRYDRVECSNEDKAASHDFSALGMVYESGGRVKPEYRDFDIIDHRASVAP